MNSRKGPKHPTIALLSDFGTESFYVGAMKAAVLSVAPGATLVDLTHGIRPYAIDEASFVLARVFDLFPPGIVFLAVVDPGVGGARNNLVFECSGRYLVAPDNGLVSDVASSFEIDSVFSINDDAIAEIRQHPGVGRTFLGRDVFGPAAGYLAGDGELERLGTRISDYQTLALPTVNIDGGRIEGVGRYVDTFGNIISNISAAHLREAFDDAPLAKIEGTINTNIGIDGIDEFFAEGAEDEVMLILNSWGLVEISVNQGSAAERFPGGATDTRIELTLP